MRVTYLLLLLFTLAGIQNRAHAAETTPLIISELYPAPLTGEQEWVELYNPTATEISLAGYTLHDELTTPSVLFTGTTEIIPPNGYLVLVIPGSKLNNTGDAVNLISPENIQIDSLTFSSSTQGKSWQRQALVSTEIALVTPTKGNASAEYSLSELAAVIATPIASASAQSTPLPPPPTPTPSATPIPTVLPTPAPTPSPITYEQLQLSEIMSCPAAGSEWIELYNASTQEVTLSGFKVQDESGNIKTISGSIPASGYATFSWTGSLLNNAGDTIDLLTPTGSSIVHAEFSNCSTGKSFVFTTDPAPGQWTATQPTSGKPNIFPTQPQLVEPLITQQSTQDEALLTNSNIPQTKVLGTQETAAYLSLKSTIPLSSLNLSTATTDSASVSALFKDTPEQKLQTVPFSMYIQKGFLLFSCIGAFTGGTLLLYERIKQTVHPLA